MADKKKNKNLHKAKKDKNDEFYTMLSDIEQEVKHYKKHLVGKKIFLNCDDHRMSNFYRYFELNFDHLGLESVTATHYHDTEKAHKLVIDRDETGFKHIHKPQPMLMNGDFRSPESIEILKESDIVITNPPFSLFREYVAQLMGYGKEFLIVGSMNAITYKEIFPLIKDNKLWLGNNNVKEFTQPDGTVKKFGNILWYTNLEHNKRNDVIKLFKKYTTKDYPKYDNYDAINVDKVVDIPADYIKAIGVPISFLVKYNPKQFEILGLANSARWISYECITILDGRKVYNRIIVKRKDTGEVFSAVPSQEVEYCENVDDYPVLCSGAMGVPISFLTRYNPKQFEIITFRKGNDGKDLRYYKDSNKVEPYFRIVIKKIKLTKEDEDKVDNGKD